MLSCLTFAVLIVSCVPFEVTFRNVTVLADSQPVHIRTSNTLRAYVPEKTVQNISFEEQDHIPILRINAITDLHRLKFLNLSHHGMETIERGAFKNLPYLETFILDGNNLTVITHGIFTNLHSLTTLSLRANRIETIAEKALINLNNLNFLLLARNNLKSFDPSWFKDKPFLFVVELNENHIEEIPDGAFEIFDKEIFLGNNKIQNLSHSMFGEAGGELQVLSLHDNEIEEWDEDVFRNVEIVTFDITYNRVKCLSGNFSDLFVARYNLVNGNPWNCSCLENIAHADLEDNCMILWGTSDEECNIIFDLENK